MELALFVPVGMVWAHLHPLTATRIKQIPEVGRQARATVEGRFRWLDQELADRAFIGGEKYSIADITALCTIDFAAFNNLEIQPDQKNLARWHHEISSRPSATA